MNNKINHHFQCVSGKVRLTHIHQNFPFALQSRVNPHFHSPQIAVAKNVRYQRDSGCEKKSVSSVDIHNKVLPLTLQSEIKQHQIISLIKGNC